MTNICSLGVCIGTRKWPSWACSKLSLYCHVCDCVKFGHINLLDKIMDYATKRLHMAEDYLICNDNTDNTNNTAHCSESSKHALYGFTP